MVPGWILEEPCRGVDRRVLEIAKPDDDWAVMCGSGVTACHLALSAALAGFSDAPGLRRLLERVDSGYGPADSTGEGPGCCGFAMNLMQNSLSQLNRVP